MRSMCSAMLTLQLIVLVLAAPVLITVQDVEPVLALSLCIGLALACLVATASLRSEWGYWLGHAIQVASIALGFLLPIMFFIGAMFAALWLGAFFLGRKIEADKARWAAEAELESAAAAESVAEAGEPQSEA